MLSVNYYLNRDFYPALLNYQAESEAAYYMKKAQIPAEQVVFAGEMQSVADVILHQPTKVVPVDSLDRLIMADKYVFTTSEGLKKIASLGLAYKTVREFEDFPVTRLTGKFINRNTRAKEVSIKYLVKVGG